MAAISNAKSRRLTGLALAISVFAMPGLALAHPQEGDRGSSHARSEQGEQEARSDEGGQGRQAQQRQQQSRPEQAQAPAPPPQPRQTSWSGSNGGGDNRQEDRRDGAHNRGQQQADRQGGEQPGWSGGHRQDGRQAGRQERRQDNRQANTWYDNRDQQSGSRNWSDADHHDRNGRHDSAGDRSTTFYNNSGVNHDDHRDHHRWDRQWRSDTTYNWYTYRSNHPGYYRLGTYYAPYRNYSYRRLTIGFFLDQLFFGQNYRINDPRYYRLPDVYGPYRWVRYYDDAVLVDAYSGEVVDVIYNFFW